MKKSAYLAVIATILLSSCDCEFDMTTIVGKDGSTTRIITCPADSAFLCGNKQMSMEPSNCDVSPIIITDDWELTYTDSTRMEESVWPMKPEQYSNEKHYVNMKRHFNSTQQMSEQFQFDLVPVKPRSEFSKKFKWFYTDYTFSETFPQPEFSIPVTDYLDMDMARAWFVGCPEFEGAPGSLLFNWMSEFALSANSWLYANYLTEVFHSIADNYDAIENPPLTKEEFLEKEKSFIETYDKGIGDDPVYDVGEGVEDALYKHFGSNAYYDFVKGNSEYLSAVWILYQYFSFDYTVVMPGKPRPVYGARTDGHAQTFNMTLGMIYPEDYTITVTSRAANVWAWIISILIVLIAIGSFIPSKRKK